MRWILPGSLGLGILLRITGLSVALWIVRILVALRIARLRVTLWVSLRIARRVDLQVRRLCIRLRVWARILWLLWLLWLLWILLIRMLRLGILLRYRITVSRCRLLRISCCWLLLVARGKWRPTGARVG